MMMVYMTHPLAESLYHLCAMRAVRDTNSDLMAAREAQHAAKVQAARARQAEEAALAASVQLESQRQTTAAQAIVRVLPATRCMFCIPYAAVLQTCMHHILTSFLARSRLSRIPLLVLDRPKTP
jgi:hypothetical protein